MFEVTSCCWMWAKAWIPSNHLHHLGFDLNIVAALLSGNAAGSLLLVRSAFCSRGGKTRLNRSLPLSIVNVYTLLAPPTPPWLAHGWAYWNDCGEAASNQIESHQIQKRFNSINLNQTVAANVATASLASVPDLFGCSCSSDWKKKWTFSLRQPQIIVLLSIVVSVFIL